jgi:hypothetical protein
VRRFKHDQGRCLGSLRDYVSIYSNRAKANEETADKTTDEVWATIAKNKKKKIKSRF